MSELDVQLAGKSLADYTNTQLRLALGAVLYTNTADMWKQYLNQLGYSGDVSQMLQKYYIDYSVPSNFRNYINAGAFIYSPQQLFADGSKGVVYDNNDLSSFYLDSAGVTPATVNGLVGLQLDKSANLALGADFCVNGGFDTDTTWIKGGGWAISGGVATKTPGVANTIQQAFSPVVGRSYKITYTLSGRTAGTIAAVFLGGTTVAEALHGSNGARSCILTAVTGNTGFGFSADSTFDGSVDNYTIQELPGNHRYQATTGSKPVLRGTPTGANLVTNGDFASGTGWTAGSGWAIGSGVATATTSSGILTSGNAVTPGNVYRLTFNATYTSGTLQVRLGGASAGFVSSTGQRVFYVTASTGVGVEFVGTTLTAVIDNVEIVDVSAGQVTAPYGLQYDGVDDFMVTAAVDFTATDKMFVCVGIQRGITTSLNMVVESSTGGGAGSFYIAAPYNATSEAAFVLNGTATGGYSVDNLSTTAPPREVYSTQYDIGAALLADEIKPRINGAIPTLSVLAAGPAGTGNFGNHAIYFGRRAGTSFPLNAVEYGLVICGKTLTSTQISQTERYIAQRTGVTI